MLKIMTCMKPVPDPASRLAIGEDKKWIRDHDLTFGPSEADEYALEAALRLTEAHGGEVVVLSLGGERSGRLLRTGLAKGAARAIQLADSQFDGGDEYATARALSRAVAKDGGADLVLTGVQSDDLGTGITGVLLAELLGWPHASVVIAVESDAGGSMVRVRRELEAGTNELLEVEIPAVLTIQYGINEPRYASLKGIMAAKKKEIRVWTAADLGLSRREVGAAGALYEVNDLLVPEQRREVQMIQGSPPEAAGSLVELLRREARAI